MWLQRKSPCRPGRRGFHLITREVLEAELGGMAIASHASSSATPPPRSRSTRTPRPTCARTSRRGSTRPCWTRRTQARTDEGRRHAGARRRRRALLGPSVSLPVAGGRLALGTWQGIYLCENTATAAARGACAGSCGADRRARPVRRDPRRGVLPRQAQARPHRQRGDRGAAGISMTANCHARGADPRPHVLAARTCRMTPVLGPVTGLSMNAAEMEGTAAARAAPRARPQRRAGAALRRWRVRRRRVRRGVQYLTRRSRSSPKSRGSCARAARRSSFSDRCFSDQGGPAVAGVADHVALVHGGYLERGGFRTTTRAAPTPG